MSHASKEFIPLNVAVLTISDTRTLETDTSGQYLGISYKKTATGWPSGSSSRTTCTRSAPR